MNADELIALRPTERTLAGLADSIARIAAAQKSVDARISEIESGMSELMMNGTASEIDAAREERAQLERSVLELTKLEAAVRNEETPIRRAEALARDQKLALSAEEKIQEWIIWHSTRYPALAAEMAEGLPLEKIALVAYRHLLNIRRQDAALLDGAELTEITSPATSYRRMITDSFSEAVKLPGVKGAPHTRDEDTPFWGNRPHLEDHKARNLLQSQEIAQLQREVLELRGQIASAPPSRAIMSNGVVVRPGAA